MIVETEHPLAGKIKGIGAPVKFHESATFATRPPPVLGQHTREVLEELEFSARKIAALNSEGCVAAC